MKRSLCLLLVVCACKGESGTERSQEMRPAVRSTAPVSEPSAPAQPVPAGSPLADQATIRFAIYHLPRPTVAARAELERLVKSAFRPPIELAVDGAPKAPTHMLIGEPPIGELRPPDADSLRYFGRGLSPEQVTAVQASEHVIIVELVAERARMHPIHRTAMEVVLALARRTGGLIWDGDTRELYTPEAWKERMKRWTKPVPYAPDLFTIHSYRSGDLVRLCTLGLGKLGLPDLVVNQVPPSSNQSMATLVNLAVQTMVQGGEVKEGGLLDVDTSAVHVTDDIEGSPPGRATLALVVAKHEEGDPSGRLWEIAFPGGPASEVQVRQEAVIDAVFGSADRLSEVEHDEEILAASRRAHAELEKKIKKRFVAGELHLDRLLVKAPFKTDTGGNEWMWVDVLTWKGTTIEGLLQNDPFEVRGLKAGARVTVAEDSVFDYMIQREDGTTEGNTTGAIMQRREKER